MAANTGGAKKVTIVGNTITGNGSDGILIASGNGINNMDNILASNIYDGNPTDFEDFGLRTIFGADAVAWRSWTPTFTNFTQGNASVTAKYIQIGKKVTFNLKVTLSSSTMGTQPQFTLPITANSTYGVHDIIGTGELKDNTGNSHPSAVYMDNTTTCELVNFSVSGTQVYFTQVTASAPFVWTDSDFFQVTGTYEAA